MIHIQTCWSRNVVTRAIPKEIGTALVNYISPDIKNLKNDWFNVRKIGHKQIGVSSFEWTVKSKLYKS
ncbi:MAG TPA: hypothetical protein PKE38_17930 [Ignavibacteriaceae bacterium]|nr:hypothetical protein [Ignavibacteriaceae bacterium]